MVQKSKIKELRERKEKLLRVVENRLMKNRKLLVNALRGRG